MGNQLIKNYDIQKDSTGVGGFNSFWKIYPGLRQDKTSSGPNMVSVFMLDKKFLDKASKSIREDLCVFLRKEPQSLAKFKHPNVLSIVEPLVEDGKNIAFVAEHTASSLQNFINNNMVSDLYSTDFEVKMHLLELLQALSFFHNDVKMAHLGVSPENIYVTVNGKWKLGGMVFTTQLLSDKLGESSYVDFSRNTDNLFGMHPNLSYSAPEVCDFSSKCSFSSDIFSLGLLIYGLFKSKADQNTNSVNCINANNLTQYKEKITSLSQNLKNQKFFQEMTPSLKTLLSKMLQSEPSLRPTVSDILGSAWFNDPFIQTISHLETLAQKDVSQQQLFLKGLSKILLKFEAKVIKTIILPNLVEYLKVEALSPIIIQIIISILDQNTLLSKGEFGEIIWPSLKALTTGKEIPAQALYLLVSNIKILCDFISNNDLQNILMPLILKCYECGVAKLQELALLNTELLVKKLDFVFIKTKILPRVLKLCTDPNSDLRRSALFCLNKIYHLFERVTIIEQVIGTLEKIKKMGADAKMNIIILNIYEGISKTIGIEVIATKILPNLVGNLSDLNLSKSEFKSYLTTIQNLLKKIEEERLSDPSAPIKEDESDMNKILKEIEDMDKDQSKKTSEIFSMMQGPTTSNDFDFLSMFDAGINSAQKNEEVNNDIQTNLNNNNTVSSQMSQNQSRETSSGPQITMSKEISSGTQINMNKNPILNESTSQKSAVIGQKLDTNFDFFNEIENSNKAFTSSTKPKTQNQGLFNQTVQMKKMQNETNNNNPLSSASNNNNPNNSQNLFNNLNMNPKSNSMTLGNNLNFSNSSQQKTVNTITASNLSAKPNLANINFGSDNKNAPKGNMMNLNYDPFSEIDQKPSLNNNNNNNSNGNSNNPFAKDPIMPSSNISMNKPIQNQSINKPIQTQAVKINENISSGWNFDDFQTISSNAKNIQTGTDGIQNTIKTNQLQNNLGFNFPAQSIPKQNQNINVGSSNLGGFNQPQNKKKDDFDFFQNAKPVEQGLKIKKINPTFKNDDLL